MVTLLTAFEITGNLDTIIVTYMGPDGNGKYTGIITRGEDHGFKTLISTKPVFDTAEEAKDTMQKVVDDTVKFVNKELENR